VTLLDAYDYAPVQYDHHRRQLTLIDDQARAR
jgi:hypothetical protein